MGNDLVSALSTDNGESKKSRKKAKNKSNKKDKSNNKDKSNKKGKSSKQDKSNNKDKSNKKGKSKKKDKKKNRGEQVALISHEDGYKKTQAELGKSRLKREYYEQVLSGLQIELVKLQEWIKDQGLRVVVIFEGRDAAGKGGVIKRITESLSPRVCRVVALGTPTEREKTQWYFQRYVPYLPASGEMILFDRSWYNRAGVERVMGFCTENELREFLRACPQFERMLIRSGIILVKYWFSVSDEIQELRFHERIVTPTKRWKLSPMDLEARTRWVEYSKAKDDMFASTDIKQAPWYVVEGDDKRAARLNCISHLLSQIEYQDLTPDPIVLPARQAEGGYVRPPMAEQTFVTKLY